MTTTASGGNLVLRWLQRESGATYTLKQSPTLADELMDHGGLAASRGWMASRPARPARLRLLHRDTYRTGAGKLFFRIQGVEN